MSNASIALLAGLLSGGFLLLGVFVGYVLEKYSSKKTRVSEAVFHVFQQLVMLNGNEKLWPQQPPIDEEALQREMDKASNVVADIIDTVAKTKGFPYTQEVVKPLAGIYEPVDIDDWKTNYSSEYRQGIDRIIRLFEKKIDNKEFVIAFHNAFEYWTAKKMERNGASPEDIEEFKKLQSQTKKHLKKK